MVHFVIDENGAVRPLCGEWGGAPSWTRIRSAVSCPRCLELLGGHETRAEGAAPALRRLVPFLARPPLACA